MIIIKNENCIVIKSTPYRIQNKSQVNIADSFVDRSNKIGVGKGEARMYIEPQSKDDLFIFDENRTLAKGKKEYPLCPYPCFLLKDNLLDYLEDVENEYLFPTKSYKNNISSFYYKRLSEVNSLDDILEFSVYKQNGSLDNARSYIGSSSYAWSLIRELSLPLITHITIYMLVNQLNPSDIRYYFEMNHSPSIIPSKNILQKTELRVIQDIRNDTTIKVTERQALIKARVGQGKFRDNVLSIMPSCPFTGISEPYLLRASHIIPWSECENNKERLDGYNGLALTPTYDSLFDLGLISFNNDGSLIISKFLPKSTVSALNLTEGVIYQIYNINGIRNEYLEYHRRKVFKN